MTILLWVLISSWSFWIQSSTPTRSPEFDSAHAIFAEYWADASAAAKTRTALARNQLRQKTTDLPRLLEGPINQGIIDYLNQSGTKSPNELKVLLAKALTPPNINDGPIQNSVDVVALMDGDVYIVTYDINYCAACSTSWIGVFRHNSNGKFLLIDHVENPGQNQTVHLGILHSELMTMVVFYGTNWGDAHNRLNVRVYSIQNQLRQIWERLDLPQGQISLSGDRLVLSFLSSLTPPWDTITETYLLKNQTISLSSQTKERNP